MYKNVQVRKLWGGMKTSSTGEITKLHFIHIVAIKIIF